MTWAARVCKKIGVPSLGTSAKSLTSVVVDILSEIFTNEARVPVTATTFIRQPADNKAKILTVARFRDHGATMFMTNRFDVIDLRNHRNA